MPQLSLYLDDETMERLRLNAQASKTSLSKYVSSMLSDQPQTTWYPEGYFDLYGCLSDTDFREPEDYYLDEIEPLFA